MGTTIRFATVEEGRARITARDAYTTRLAAHELQARTQVPEAVDLDRFLRHCAAEVRAWDPHERQSLQDILRETEEQARKLGIRLPLPEQVFLIKTTGQEEGGADGYTREDSIFLKEGSASPRLFAHELFHVATRRDPQLATRAYELLGFREIPALPNDDPTRVSNPDTLELRHAIEVRHRGESIEVCPVLRGRWPYRGGSFFHYIEKRLLVLEARDGGYAPRLSDGRPTLLRYEDVEGLLEKLGRNTVYDFHPEEISAVHFELLFAPDEELPDPHLVEGLRDLLARGEA